MALTRNIKVLVNNPEQSKAIQEYLFTQGCSWAGGDTHPKYLESTSLYVSVNGNMAHDDVSEDTFRNNSKTEVFFDFETTVTAVPQDRPKVLVFGKIYDKAEFDAAMAKLNPI